ncbi:SMI1/KNR4 family protein [Chitinophaga nivalis]|uniref:SMI1/KNR4 family protein n=1 Tax=Chitinophaga nivalis TaxID=2991709 RepID=A0ABT3IIX8_9BACT|nr:SMI1/KNR4 family protein [Chitinophaga nivalis]MCW3466433.1 SMI1/KNR4 family protein [Chitinophaga nivalis]MCW3483876.1 SMI1/KNR4 family protein [Chitinophaga nivalis]
MQPKLVECKNVGIKKTNIVMQEYIQLLEKNPPVDPNVLTVFLSQIDFTPPVDYIDFIKQYNGAEGKIGNNQYLKLWGVEELIDLNKDYEVDLYAAGYFIFGSNLGGTAYAFNKKESSIVTFEFIGMLMDDEAIFCGANFLEFLKYLHKESN